MRAIFDDYYYLSLISAQKSNSIAILCYNYSLLPFSLCKSKNCLLLLHHETISTHYNSSNILFISHSIRSVQHRHADQHTPQGYAKNDAVHNTRTTASVLAASAARLSCLCPITKPNGADRPHPGTCQSTPSHLCHQSFRLSQRPIHKKKSPT